MFTLSKWYLDCVTGSGSAAILYQATLRWGLLRLDYAAVLHAPSRGEAWQRATLRVTAQPVPARDAVRWQCSRLDVSGTWHGSAPGCERTLLQSPEGVIHWQCLCPRATARVRIGGQQLRGTGYVERLTMTVKPWRLPFDELRWGRMVGRHDSLVWIDWRGATARTFVWHNARPIDGRVHDDRLELPGGLTLALRNAAVLRSGTLRDTALRPIRPLARVLPRWRDARETKWLAWAALRVPDLADAGWSVHERVRWR